MSVLTVFNINDVNGVVLVSWFLTVNIFQTSFWLLTLNRQTLSWFILKRQSLLKTRSGTLCCDILSVNIIYKQIAFELIRSKPFRWISEKFLRRSLFQMLILAKKMQLTFKWPAVCTFVFLQILLSRGLENWL